MFLDATCRRNPELVESAIELLQTGDIGPNTYVIDLDRITSNARLLANEAGRLGLSLHAMTKQHGRNPFVARAALAGGIRTAVAVDVPEARLLAHHGIPIGHVGHLVQVPTRDIAEVLRMRPGAITVFSVDAARRVSAAANEIGVVQDVLLRVWKPGDFLHPGQEGGFRVSEVATAAREICRLSGVRVAGVTSFPCLAWDHDSETLRATGNLESVTSSAGILRDELGLALDQVNAPGVTAVTTLSLIEKAGATHGEPGSSLSGNTPLHADGSGPEMPAMVYVTEIASVDDDRAYCFGGGFYARSRLRRGLLVGRHGRRLLDAPRLPPGVIDYYGWLDVDGGPRPEVGDPVVFAFRAQVFVGRCQVAAVAGLSSARPRLVGICDQHGNVLGRDQLPLGPVEAQREVRVRWEAEVPGAGR